MAERKWSLYYASASRLDSWAAVRTRRIPGIAVGEFNDRYNRPGSPTARMNFTSLHKLPGTATDPGTKAYTTVG